MEERREKRLGLVAEHEKWERVDREIRRAGDSVDQKVLDKLDEAKVADRKHDEEGAPARTANYIAVASSIFISIDKVVAELQRR